MGGWLAGWLAGGLAACAGRAAFGGAARWPTDGVAGLPGGATLTIRGVAAAPVGRRPCNSAFGRGSPGVAARACCCFTNGTGGGGGARLATTSRFMTAAGGAVTRFAVEALAPRTL